MESRTTIKKLFDDDKIQFIMPPYQRAYSWGAKKDSDNDKQVIKFVNNLKVEKGSFFIGIFLFGKNGDDENKIFVIEGSQRLTTIAIFFSCLHKTLKEREKEGVVLTDTKIELKKLWKSIEPFLTAGKRRKIKTVDVDDDFFINLIFQHNKAVICDTDSRRRISEAYFYFLDEMNKESSRELIRWKEMLESAVVLKFIVNDNIDATELFNHKSDHGKELTIEERLKALLIHQVYLHSDAKHSGDILQYVESEFSELSEVSERIKILEESQILDHYCIAFFKGYAYSLQSIKKELSAAEDKIKWIKEFCSNLKNAFVNVEVIQKKAEGNSSIGDILILDAPNAWALLLKIFHYHFKQNDSNVKDPLENIFRMIEETIFKNDYPPGNFQNSGSLHYVAKNYTGDIADLNVKLERASKEGLLWQSAFEERFINYIERNNHYNKLTGYLLWKYENRLRKKVKMAPITAKEYLNKFGTENLDSTLERISQENLNLVNRHQEFESNYLNNVGNLVLMDAENNSQVINEELLGKAVRYGRSSLLSQVEIGNTIKAVGKWGEEEIIARQKKIVEFAKYYWIN